MVQPMDCLTPILAASKNALDVLRETAFTLVRDQPVEATYADECEYLHVRIAVKQLSDALKRHFRPMSPEAPRKGMPKYGWKLMNLDHDTNVILHRLNDATVDLEEWVQANGTPPGRDHVPMSVRPVITPTLFAEFAFAVERLSSTVAPPSVTTPVDETEARHSSDFASVYWYGTTHVFTTNQAACVRVLWEAWTNKTPVLAVATILEDAGVEMLQDRLSVVFRDHAAWGTMIVEVGRGRYKLNSPAHEDTPVAQR